MAKAENEQWVVVRLIHGDNERYFEFWRGQHWVTKHTEWGNHPSDAARYRSFGAAATEWHKSYPNEQLPDIKLLEAARRKWGALESANARVKRLERMPKVTSPIVIPGSSRPRVGDPDYEWDELYGHHLGVGTPRVERHNTTYVYKRQFRGERVHEIFKEAFKDFEVQPKPVVEAEVIEEDHELAQDR